MNTTAPTSRRRRERQRPELQHRRGGPNSRSSRSHACRAGARVEQLGEVSRGDRVGVPRLAVPLGRRVAVHLVAVGVDDDDGRRRQRVERRREPVALDSAAASVSLETSAELVLDAVAAVARAAAGAGAQPNRPVM